MSTPAPSQGHGGVNLRGRSRALWATVVVALAALLGNFSYVIGLRTNDPLVYESGLGSPTQGGSSKPFYTMYSNYPEKSTFGGYTIDPNNGWTVQALGRLSARMWSHGHVPLWNVYEGLGQPLAGEMQSAAFFLPFVLFQLLPNGVFAMHLALELVAGLSTLALLRTMRLSWRASTLGGILFALNGSFSVMTNAPFNPIAFLPMALWGVELVARGAKEKRRSRAGMWIIALAIAWMLFAGFPETALLEAFFVLLWSLVRLVDLEGVRRAFTLWCGVGAVLGVALALPILVALKGFLGFGYTAYHGGESAHWYYSAGKFAGLGLYYGQGVLGRGAIAGGIAGYVTLSAVAMAVVGLFSSRQSRWLRLIVGVLILVFTLNAFGFTPANVILNVIPGMQSVLLYKYGLLIIEFGVIILAAFGLDDVLRREVAPRAIVGAAVTAFSYLAWALWYTSENGGFPDGLWNAWVIGITVVLLVATLASAACGLRPGSGSKAGVAAIIFVALEAIGTFAVPQVTSSASENVDLAPIHYLQEHQGTARFYSIGPIEANYGSYWNLAQLNVNDLPVPQKMSDFIMKSLKPPESSPLAKATGRAFIPYELSPLGFTLDYQKSLFAAYLMKQKAYQDAGVKYLVTKQGVTSSSVANKYGLTNVFSDKNVVIWQDSGARPYYETNSACSIRDETLFDATVTCKQPSTLIRRQLATPDWAATVNGSQVSVGERSDGLFQSIELPAGTSKVSFSYIPKYFGLASGVSLLVLLGMMLDGLFFLRIRRKTTDRKGIAHAVS